MARRNRPRAIGAEANLAERIRLERGKRGWTPTELAERMTAAGCSLAGSAAYKIEDREAPRRISVDELVALAKVFETTVTDLLTQVEVLEKEHAKQLLTSLDEADGELGAAAARVVKGHIELFELAATDPELFEYVKRHRDWARSFSATIAGGRDAGGDDQGAYTAFYQTLIEQAERMAGHGEH